MDDESMMRPLIREMIRLGASEETSLGVLVALDTEENFRTMLKRIKPLEEISRTALLALALLIGDGEDDEHYVERDGDRDYENHETYENYEDYLY